jgi:uncharacterized membrane protein
MLVKLTRVSHKTTLYFNLVCTSKAEIVYTVPIYLTNNRFTTTYLLALPKQGINEDVSLCKKTKHHIQSITTMRIKILMMI